MAFRRVSFGHDASASGAPAEPGVFNTRIRFRALHFQHQEFGAESTDDRYSGICDRFGIDIPLSEPSLSESNN